MIKTMGAHIYTALELVQELQKEVLEVQEAGGRISYQEAFAIRLLGYTKEEMEDLDMDICMLGGILMSLSKMIVERVDS